MVARLGLGAPLPAAIKDGDARRQDLASNDKLRRQLLGKDFQRLQGKGLKGSKSVSGSIQLGSKPRPVPVKRELESEDEDEAGRSSVGKSKRKKVASSFGVANGQEGEDVNAPDGGATQVPRPPKKASNYLDEVLAERSWKKQKRKNKKKRKDGGEDVLC